MNDLKALFLKILQYLHQRRACHKKMICFKKSNFIWNLNDIFQYVNTFCFLIVFDSLNRKFLIVSIVFESFWI